MRAAAAPEGLWDGQSRIFPQINDVWRFKSPLPKPKKRGKSPPRAPFSPPEKAPAQRSSLLTSTSPQNGGGSAGRWFLYQATPRAWPRPPARAGHAPSGRLAAQRRLRGKLTAHARPPPAIVRAPCGAVLIRGGRGGGAMRMRKSLKRAGRCGW